MLSNSGVENESLYGSNSMCGTTMHIEAVRNNKKEYNKEDDHNETHFYIVLFL